MVKPAMWLRNSSATQWKPLRTLKIIQVLERIKQPASKMACENVQKFDAYGKYRDISQSILMVL